MVVKHGNNSVGNKSMYLVDLGGQSNPFVWLKKYIQEFSKFLFAFVICMSIYQDQDTSSKYISEESLGDSPKFLMKIYKDLKSCRN